MIDLRRDHVGRQDDALECLSQIAHEQMCSKCWTPVQPSVEDRFRFRASRFGLVAGSRAAADVSRIWRRTANREDQQIS